MSANLTRSQRNIAPDQERRPIRGLTRFFCWCGGANIDVLERYRNSKNILMTGGVLVFFTGMFAWLSGGYAVYTIFESTRIAVAVGFVWGAFIFFMDRFFVASIRKREDGRKVLEILQASPRILLAILIGFVVARPLELQIFQPEIEKELNEQKSREILASDSLFQKKYLDLQGIQEIGIDSSSYDGQIADYDTRIAGLEQQIRDLYEQEKVLDQAYMCERYANSPCPPGYFKTNKPGDGPEAKKRKAAYNAFVADMGDKEKEFKRQINSLKTRRQELQTKKENEDLAYKDRLKSEQDTVLARQASNKKRIEDDFEFSLLNRNQALTVIEAKEPGARGMIWFVTIFFIFLEIAPVLGKILAPYSSYDSGLVEARYADEDDLARRRYVSKEELKVNRMLVNMLSKAQRDVVKERIQQWRSEEIKRETREREAERARETEAWRDQ